MNAIVIVGSGLAGYTLARELRKRDRESPITIVTRDRGEFYAKPSLSNALAQSKAPEQLVTTPGPTLASQLGIELLAQTTVERIDTPGRRLHTSAGPLAYDRLVLATGADPISLCLEGDAAGSLRQVNDLDDYRAFRAQIGAGQRVAILGAGLIGSEFANDLRTAGVQVDVVDLASRPLAALLPEQAGHWFEQRLAAAGVRWHFGDAAQALEKHDGHLALSLRSGARLQAETVLSAVGLRPRTALAAQAGLSVGRGVVVDALGATSDPAIYALGDCAEYSGRLLPYVQPIMVAARSLAATLTGTSTPIEFGPMPVIVKTPACPVTVLPPPAQAPGRWEAQAQTDGLAMRFLDPEDRLLGFALLGAASPRRRELMEQLGRSAAPDKAAVRQEQMAQPI
jgi:rubredoxin-NAD+ reductase